jgi:DNA-binding response OmpR family regulator
MKSEEALTLQLGCLSIHPSCLEVRTGEKRIRLTRKELAVLWTLATDSGKAFRREELIRQAWGENVFVTPRTVDVYVAKLRKKLGFLCTELPRIETVWGIGYRLRYPNEARAGQARLSAGPRRRAGRRRRAR